MSLSDSANAVLEGVARRLQRPAWHWSIAILITIFYLVSSLYVSVHRLLWYDEIVTAIMSRTRDVGTLWNMLKVGVEQVPLLYFLVTRTSDRLFGPADWALRVPSAVALSAGLLIVFDTARRLAGGLAGLVAMAFLSTSFISYYGFEARPYGIFFMLAGLAYWVWLFTNQDGKGSALAFGAILFLGVMTHYYFMFCMVPFAAAGLVQRRPFAPKVIAGCVGVLLALAGLWPQISSSRASVGVNLHTWAEPTFFGLQNVYLEFFPHAIFPLVLLALTVALYSGRQNGSPPPMGRAEQAGWFFMLTPIVVFLCAKFVTHFFYNRYMIGVIPGVVVAAVCLLWRYFGNSPAIPVPALLLFATFGLRQEALLVSKVESIQAFGDHQARTRQMLGLENTLLAEGKDRFTIDYAPTYNLLFLEAWYYSKRPDHYWLYSTEKKWALADYVPVQFTTVDEIVKNARATALISPTPELIAQLEAAGFHLRMRYLLPFPLYYLE